MIALMLALALVQDRPAEPGPEWTCPAEQAVRLGGSNTESAEAVVRAAWARCTEHEATLRSQARGTASMNRYGAGHNGDRRQDPEEIFEDMRRQISDDATLALLEARAAKASS